MDNGFLSYAKQIGYAVFDVDAKINRILNLGIDRDIFNIFEVSLTPETDYRYRGRPSTCTLKIALGNFDGIDHEYIEVLDGEHPARDFLQAYGEGINHLGFYVDDIDPWVSRMIEGGCESVIDGRFHLPNGRQGSFAYLVDPISPSPMFEFIAM